MASLSNTHQRHSERTYYLHRDSSVTKTPSPHHLLRIRAVSKEQASLMAMALQTKLRLMGIYLAFQEV